MLHAPACMRILLLLLPLPQLRLMRPPLLLPSPLHLPWHCWTTARSHSRNNSATAVLETCISAAPVLPSTLTLSSRNFSKEAMSMILSSTGLEQSRMKVCDFAFALGPAGFRVTATILASRPQLPARAAAQRTVISEVALMT